MPILNYLGLALIFFYQKFISPLKRPSCRFYPSCSHYAMESFQRFPFHKALWYSVSRIIKCHPFHPGGHDPVPGCCHK